MRKMPLIICLVLAILGISTRISAQSLSPSSFLRIAFVSDRNGSSMAYATTLDGTNVQNILADDRQTNSVGCSPDGKSILTDAGGKEIDQTDVLSLVTTPIFSALPTLYGDPSWSPEGNRIAFNWITNNSSDIYIGNKDGTNITRLTNSPGSDRFPNWSADGTKIVFASERNNSPGIFTINVNGTNETRLTSNTFLDTFPAWSIDGTKIAFTRYMASSADIYLINSDGTNLTRVTGPNNGINWGANWSPDGTKIAFTSSRDGNPEVYVMNPDGSGQTRITNNPSTDEAACWLRPINTRPNTGKGLRVQYFHNLNFVTPNYSVLMPTVNFNWAAGAPVGIGVDTLSARWVGKIEPQFSEAYTFYVTHDDGARLWVNGQQLVNNWNNVTSAVVDSGTITLAAGVKYDITLEYYENTGNA